MKNKSNHLTPEQKARVFSLHWGARITSNHPNYRTGGVVNGANPKGVFINSATGFEALRWNDEPKLLLHPRQTLHGADLTTVAEMLNYDTEKHPRAFITKHTRDFLRRLQYPSGDFYAQHVNIFQFLLQKGYAVPLFFGPGHPDNGKDAIELGLAVAYTVKMLKELELR